MLQDEVGVDRILFKRQVRAGFDKPPTEARYEEKQSMMLNMM